MGIGTDLRLVYGFNNSGVDDLRRRAFFRLIWYMGCTSISELTAILVSSSKIFRTENPIPLDFGSIGDVSIVILSMISWYAIEEPVQSCAYNLTPCSNRPKG